MPHFSSWLEWSSKGLERTGRTVRITSQSNMQPTWDASDTLNLNYIRSQLWVRRTFFKESVYSSHKAAWSSFFAYGVSSLHGILRWLKTVSSTKILMDCYSHSLSLATTIMVAKNCPTIGEHVVVLFIT